MTIATSCPDSAPLAAERPSLRDLGADIVESLRAPRGSSLRANLRRVVIVPFLWLVWIGGLASVSVFSLCGLSIAISGDVPLAKMFLDRHILGRELEFHQRAAAVAYLEKDWSAENGGSVLIADTGSLRLPDADLAGRRQFRVNFSADINHPAVAHGLFLDLLFNGKPAHRWEIRHNGLAVFETDVEGNRAFQTGERALLTFVLSSALSGKQATIARTMTLPRLRISAR